VEFLAGEHDKFKVQDIGPYVYKEILERNMEYQEQSQISFSVNSTENPKLPDSQ
jgi:hypothetical protein